MLPRARLDHPLLVTLLVLPLLLASVACTPADDADPGDAETAVTESEPRDSAASPAVEGWLGEVRVGRAVDPQGAVLADQETASFSPGDSIYASIEIDGAPANAAVHAVFYDAAGEKVAEDEKKVPAEARYLYFDAGDTSNWLPGEYRIEMAVDGEVRSRETITVGSEPAAAEGA